MGPTKASPSTDGWARLLAAPGQRNVGIRCVRGEGFTAPLSEEEKSAAEKFAERRRREMTARAAATFSWESVASGSYPVPSGDAVKLVKLDRFKVSKATPSATARSLCALIQRRDGDGEVDVCKCIGARSISYAQQTVLATRNLPIRSWMVGRNGRLDEDALHRRIDAFADRCVKDE